MFTPRYQITPAITKALISLEADRQAIIELPIDVEMLRSLRETARLAATHYSTQIEGNRLTQTQVEETLAGAHFPGRERDTTEVRNYYRAIEEVERLTQHPGPITEAEIRLLHGLVMNGRPSPYPVPRRSERDPGQHFERHRLYAPRSQRRAGAYGRPGGLDQPRAGPK